MSKNIVLKLFRLTDIRLGTDITVHDDSFYNDLLKYKTLGFGESFMSAKIETPNLESLCIKLQRLNVLSIMDYLKILSFWNYLYLIFYVFWKIYNFILFNITNFNTILRSKKVAKVHYNLPDVLYTHMLDPTMLYSCGYFKDTNNLETAQTQKADLIITKLHISDGDEILEIGCGWGFIAARIANANRNVNVTAITISSEQIKYCNQKYKLPNLRFILIDYRQIPENSFNKIYSVGMFEHVGAKNYKDFFNITYKLLKDDGIMLLHTICKSKYNPISDPWFEKYIFPGGYLPSVAEISRNIELTNYSFADLQEFGYYYATTLQCWLDNFENTYSQFSHLFDDKFKRMWKLYLIFSKVGFNSGHIKLHQFVFTKSAVGVYHRN
jgi:cyclopropane-fatty-acyl-phospholipid synthase